MLLNQLLDLSQMKGWMVNHDTWWWMVMNHEWWWMMNVWILPTHQSWDTWTILKESSMQGQDSEPWNCDPIRRRSWHSKFWTEWREHVEVYVNAIDYRKCMVSTQGRWNTKIQGCNDDVQGGKTLKRQQGRETFGSSWKDEKLSRLPQWNQAKARQFLKPGSIATVHTSRAQSARALLGNLKKYCWWSKISCTSWYGKHSHCQVGQDFWNINSSKLFARCLGLRCTVWSDRCTRRARHQAPWPHMVVNWTMAEQVWAARGYPHTWIDWCHVAVCRLVTSSFLGSAHRVSVEDLNFWQFFLIQFACTAFSLAFILGAPIMQKQMTCSSKMMLNCPIFPVIVSAKVPNS